MPAGPAAGLPVELGHTEDGVGVIDGAEGLQSTTWRQIVTSLSVGVTVLTVVERRALYWRYRFPLNWESEAPLVVKKVPDVPSGPTKLKGPEALLLAATWKRRVVFAGVVAVQESVVHVADEPVTAPLSFVDE